LFRPGNSDELATYIDTLAHDVPLRKRMGAESLNIIAGHDRSKILGEWEELYRRLAIEFHDAKERRKQLRLAQKNRLKIPQELQNVQLPHIRRTGDLAFDQTQDNRRRRRKNENSGILKRIEKER